MSFVIEIDALGYFVWVVAGKIRVGTDKVGDFSGEMKSCFVTVAAGGRGCLFDIGVLARVFAVTADALQFGNFGLVIGILALVCAASIAFEAMAAEAAVSEVMVAECAC